MKLIYSPTQRGHNPSIQIDAAGSIQHPETPERCAVLLERLTFLDHVEPKPFHLSALARVHSQDYLDYFQSAYDEWIRAELSPAGVIPNAFPRKLGGIRPERVEGIAGWYCNDTFTPITAGTYQAALASAATAITGATLIASGENAAYSMCRPPGHHAGPGYSGGYCYLNNAALAAAELRAQTNAKVAVLDIDYHHGDGTQDIFYEDDSILFISIHGEPTQSYPFFSGHADETGRGKGLGANLNIPLAPQSSQALYDDALQQASAKILSFGAQSLVVSFGADVCSGDSEGYFDIGPEYLRTVAQSLLQLRLPTLVVQEGGYTLESLSDAAFHFLSPFATVQV